jgi:putative hydrolase of the HAD superfamily
MSRPGCNVLVLDLDDTIYPERDYVLSGFDSVDRWLSEQRGIAGFANAARAHFQAGKRGNIFDLSLQELGVKEDAAFISTLVNVYREHRPTIEMYEDAAWALAHFRALMKVGIITDGYLVAQRNKVAALGLEAKVDAIIFSDLYGREHWKPSTVPFSKLVEQLGCAHPECIYVADNPTKDFVGARSLGWRTVQIARPGGEYCERIVAESHQAEQTIRSLFELRDILA